MKNLPIRRKLVLSFVAVLVFPMVLGPILLVALYSVNHTYAEQIQGYPVLARVVESNTTLVNTLIAITVVAIFVMLFLAVFFILKVSNAIRRPAEEMLGVARSVAVGDVDVRIEYQSKDELGQLGDAFRRMVDAVREQGAVIGRLADGDYTASIAPRSERDTVNRSLARLIETNSTMLAEIRDAAEQVAVASHQIAQGAQGLAAGSSEQAATMERFANILDDMHGSSGANAELAAGAAEDAASSRALMARSMDSLLKLAESMQAIEDSSQSITKVIKVIDDIAFQTNILALNAAVEAARAGAHGKGFAVVADEVRNLASKSAEAARETAALIEGSSAQVRHGRQLMTQTSSELAEVAELTRSNADTVEKIARASQDQRMAIDEINVGVGEITVVVQSNAATAEQSAAASEQMSAQSGALRDIVEGFRLGDMDAERSTALYSLDDDMIPPISPEEAGFALAGDKYA